MTLVTHGAATFICGSGRLRSAARAARTGSSGSVTRLPGAWTGTSVPAPGTGKRGGRSCGWGGGTGGGPPRVDGSPHRFRHHFSHTWLDRGGPEGDLMELNGWTSPQMLRRYGASARSARARRTYDRIMTDT